MKQVLSAFVLSMAAACGDAGPVAIEHDDPLHAGGIALPPPVEYRAVRRAQESTEIHAPPPPFTEGIFPCSRCHEGGPAMEDAAPAQPHQKHLDRDLTCEDCHMPDDEPEPSIPGVAVCFDCHEDLAEEPEPVRAYFAAIRKGAEYVFPRRWKTRDVRPAHAKHAAAGVACAMCHGEPSNGPFEKPKSVSLMERCTGCHEERRVPATRCESCHEEIRHPQHQNIVLKHAEEQRGCFGCHNPADRDTLRLASGETVSFEKSYRLCGQCHGPKLRDWKMGLHGKRTGMWDGAKEYLLCVHCHTNPHAPQFPKMKPDPPPVRPEEIR